MNYHKLIPRRLPRIGGRERITLEFTLFHEQQYVLNVPPIDIIVIPELPPETIDWYISFRKKVSGPIIGPLLIDGLCAPLMRNSSRSRKEHNTGQVY